MLRLGPPLAATAVRALGATLRISDQGVEALEPLWAAGRPLIYAVWHGRILMVPWLNVQLRRTHGARLARVLASRSRDAEMVARWVQRFGLAVVPEIYQRAFTPEHVAAAAEHLLQTPAALAAQRQGFAELRGLLGEPGVGERAARHVLALAQC